MLSLVAVAKLLANRASVAKVERVREQVEHILHGQIAANESSAQLTQPMLGNGKNIQKVWLIHSL